MARSTSTRASLSIPPVTERKDEVERLLEAYASDAVADLRASWLGLRPGDSELVLDSGIATHDELEEFARRLVTIRNWGISEGAKRLGITHGALSRWALRWRIPR